MCYTPLFRDISSAKVWKPGGARAPSAPPVAPLPLSECMLMCRECCILSYQSYYSIFAYCNVTYAQKCNFLDAKRPLQNTLSVCLYCMSDDSAYLRFSEQLLHKKIIFCLFVLDSPQPAENETYRRSNLIKVMSTQLFIQYTGCSLNMFFSPRIFIFATSPWAELSRSENDQPIEVAEQLQFSWITHSLCHWLTDSLTNVTLRISRQRDQKTLNETLQSFTLLPF